MLEYFLIFFQEILIINLPLMCSSLHLLYSTTFFKKCIWDSLLSISGNHRLLRVALDVLSSCGIGLRALGDVL